MILLKRAMRMLIKEWRTFSGITLVYGLGVFIFVKSFSISASTDVASTTTTGVGGKVQEAFSQLGTILADANSSLSAASSVYQIIVSTIIALAFIWTFRKVLSDEKVSVKASLYEGMTPLVKYLLVLSMFGVQLIPMAIGGSLFGMILQSGFFFGAEIWGAGFVFALLCLWSLRMITHTVFALFITTLPDITPVKALRSAKKMVYRRRLNIWRKFGLALTAIAFAGFILMLPFVLWWPTAAPLMFFVVTVLFMPVGQAFLYTLYREIL